MTKLSAIIVVLATTTAVLEARVYAVYEKNGDLDGYVRDQRVNSYNDYAEQREREFGFGKQSGSFGQQTGFLRRAPVSSANDQQAGFNRRPIGDQSIVGIRNPPTVYHQNTGFGQQTGLARQYPGVYTPNREVTHLSFRNRPAAYGYGYDPYGR